MARKTTPPNITITELFMLRKYCNYLLENVESSGLPKDVWIQVFNCLDKLEILLRNGKPITYEDLVYIRKKKQKVKLLDERNILIFAMVFYRNDVPDIDEYELFVMRDIEEKLGNPRYLKETRSMTPEWFTEMELKRGNELLDY